MTIIREMTPTRRDRETERKKMILTKGLRYNENALTVIGWTDGDGSGHEGYNAADYFDQNGEYLGPDEFGIEPVFEEKA